MRMEDADLGRCRPAYRDDILAGLQWLGLDWDGDVVYQSERGELYRAALAKLETYRCRCTRKDLRVGIDLPDGVEPVYPGTCRLQSISAAETAVRWRVPKRVVIVEDGICGRVQQDLERDVGDFLLVRRDGVFAYQFAVVVDDMEMGVTQVVRGQDLLDSTPRQVALLEAMGSPVPRYYHLPLLLSADGDKLSKRGKAIALAQVREQGIAPTRVLGWLAHSLGLASLQEREISLLELLVRFDLHALPREPTVLLDSPRF